MSAEAAAAASVAASAAAVAASIASSAAVIPPPHVRPVATSGPLAPRPFTTTQPPPIESLGMAYFPPLMTPLLVSTRVPQPAPNKETVNTFLRIQAGGGSQTPEGILWNMTLILHSYAPNEQESVAEQNLATALAWGANAQGTTLTLKNGDVFYVTYSRANGVGHRQGDPFVDLIRYRGMISWRVQGKPLTR